MNVIQCAHGAWQRQIAADLLQYGEIPNPISDLGGRAGTYNTRYQISLDNMIARMRLAGHNVQYVPGVRGGRYTAKYRLVAGVQTVNTTRKYSVSIRNWQGEPLITATTTAEGPTIAAATVYNRYRHSTKYYAAAPQHFAGGDTWHIQFGYADHRFGGTHLDSKVICSIEEIS